MGTINHWSVILRSFSIVSNSAKRNANGFFKVLLLSSHLLISRHPVRKLKFGACAVCRTFFSEITHNPSEVKWSAPKIHQTFGQLTDSDLSIISKDFWNNRGQNSLVKKGGIRFYLTLPGKSVLTYGRTYGDVITKFCQMDSLPNFITHSAPLSTPLDTIVTTDTLAVNNLSVNNKYYLYLQTHESSRMQLSSRSLSRQIRNRINCSNVLLTSECIFRKSLLAAKKRPL